MKVYLIKQEWEIRINDKITTDYVDVQKTYIGDSKEYVDRFLSLVENKEDFYKRLENGERVQLGTCSMTDFIEKDNVAIFGRYVMEVAK